MGVLRGEPGNSQSEIALYNQTNGLRSVNWLAHGAPWSVYALRIFVCRIIHRPLHLANLAVLESFLLIKIICLLFLNWFDF
jgi:hypothetical protein